MAKKKAPGGEATGPKPRPRRDDVAIKFDRALAEKAKIIAIRRGVSMAEYLTELSRGPIDREYAKVVREMGEKAGE